MRNLVEFPITKEEIIGLLRRLQEDFQAEEKIGDMRALLLERTIKIIEKEFE
jgi:hypothetical protein